MPLWDFGMLLLAIQGIVPYAVFRACWRIFCRLVVKNDLDNVPGPMSHSFWKGESCCVLCEFHYIVNRRQLFENIQHQCLGFPPRHRAQMYVVSYILCMRAHLSTRRRDHPNQRLPWCMSVPWRTPTSHSTLPQDKQLYVSDPKALHHIVVKVSKTHWQDIMCQLLMPDSGSKYIRRN